MSDHDGEAATGAAGLQRLSEVDKEVCNNIRVTDEIGFKLLGTVSLAAGIGSGALTVLEKGKFLEGGLGPLALLALSVLGLLITGGLFV